MVEVRAVARRSLVASRGGIVGVVLLAAACGQSVGGSTGAGVQSSAGSRALATTVTSTGGSAPATAPVTSARSGASAAPVLTAAPGPGCVPYPLSKQAPGPSDSRLADFVGKGDIDLSAIADWHPELAERFSTRNAQAMSARLSNGSPSPEDVASLEAAGFTAGGAALWSLGGDPFEITVYTFDSADGPGRYQSSAAPRSTLCFTMVKDLERPDKAIEFQTNTAPPKWVVRTWTGNSLVYVRMCVCLGGSIDEVVQVADAFLKHAA